MEEEIFDSNNKNNKKKSKDYFDVNDDKVFQLMDALERKQSIVEVNMVTCKRIKVTWLTGKITKEEIQKFLDK